MANEAKQLARDYLEAVDDVEKKNRKLKEAQIRAREYEMRLQGYWNGDVIIPVDDKVALLIQKMNGTVFVNKIGIIDEETACCTSI